MAETTTMEPIAVYGDPVDDDEGVRQWGRKVSLIVGDEEALDLSALSFSFGIKRNDVKSPNTATIKVMNASRETASLVQREFTRVVLQAGYEGNYGVIFHGNVVRAKWGGSGDTETVLEITAADGDKAYNFAVVNATVPKGSSRADKVKLLCSAMNPYGVRQGYVPDLGGKKSIRGAVMSGMVRDYLQDVCGSANTLWSIQDGKVVVVPETAYVPGSVPVLSHDSGLVGMPEQTEKGIKLRMLLNPSIRVGGLVNLDNSRIAEYGFQARSEGKDANEIDRTEQRRISGDGYYYVMEVEHRGNTRDDEWYTEVLCLATDATLFPGDLGRAGAEGDAAKPAAVVKQRAVRPYLCRKIHEPT